MCGHCDFDNQITLVGRARRAADEIIEHYYRIPVRKAYDLGSTRGFDRAVADLASELRAKIRASDEAAVRSVIEVLNVDWRTTTAPQRNNLVSQALNAAGRSVTIVPQKIQIVFDEAAEEVVKATRGAARSNQKLAIGADFNALDNRIVRHLKTSQANFVRDEYGRRHEAFGREARRIVSQGLESGLGQADIASDLRKAAQKHLAGKGSFYWDVVAGAFVGRGRSFSQLSAFAEAGIDRYVIEAVLDEVTTEICRYLHGKTFSVDRGIKLFEQVEKNPDNIKDLNPWIRKGKDEEGRTILYVNRGESRATIAEVARSGVGVRDDPGSFKRGLSERELMDHNIGPPPYHGL